MPGAFVNIAHALAHEAVEHVLVHLVVLRHRGIILALTLVQHGKGDAVYYEAMKTIVYPFIPEGKDFQYVPEDNAYMRTAREYALAHSLDDTVKTGSVVVKGNMIVGQGANGSDYHKTHQCERVRLKVPTGESYEL